MSDTVFDLVIIGGGCIGWELATIFSGPGSRVTVIGTLFGKVTHAFTRR